MNVGLLSISATDVADHYILQLWFLLPFCFMAALHSRCGYSMLLLWFLLSSFFPRFFSAVPDWMSTILPQYTTHDMAWP